MKKFYATTPIYYVNDKPHLGHAYTSLVADVYTRFHRAQGDEVFFLTGTDEHGRKIVEAAEKAGLDPQTFVDNNVQLFEILAKSLNLTPTYFIRTTDQARHWPVVEEVWNKLVQRGDIYKGTYKGLYCVGHEAFLKPSDLVEGICPDHNKKPDVIEEENYFFKLSKYGPALEEALKNGDITIIPESRKNEVLGLLREGLEDVSFSRPRKDLAWGIPVPGDETQTIYVWADALTNYLSGLGNERNLFFPPDLQVLGKDILRFHAAIWPAMLMSLELPLPRTLLVHGHITVEGKKMSKSLGNSIDPITLVQTYGVDTVRYYLLREIRITDDGDFSYKKLEERYESDLVNGLSNLIHRVLSLAWNNKELLENINTGTIRLVFPETYQAHIAGHDLSGALEEVWKLIAFADKRVNDTKLWELPKKDPAEFALQISELLQTFHLLALLLAPFLPETSEKILSNITLEKKPEPLFMRLKK